jgi:aspartyl protease family protein
VVELGYVRVLATIANLDTPALKLDAEFLVDTGAMYTVIPQTVSKKIGLKEMSRRKFRTGSGGVELPMSYALLTFEGETVPITVVITPEEETPMLLGVTTLEQLGLQVDPVNGKLIPIEMLLL